VGLFFARTWKLTMPKPGDHYRQKAEECRLNAEKASHPGDKAMWLSLAEQWQVMAERYASKTDGQAIPAPQSEKPSR
jgi:hypothetical protein